MTPKKLSHPFDLRPSHYWSSSVTTAALLSAARVTRVTRLRPVAQIGKSGGFHGKIPENHGETMGKPWGNHRKTMENLFEMAIAMGKYDLELLGNGHGKVEIIHT